MTFSIMLLLGSGSDLLFRAVSSQVPSALKGLTSVFGMDTGVTPSPLPPEIYMRFSFSSPLRTPSVYQLSFPLSIPFSAPQGSFLLSHTLTTAHFLQNDLLNPDLLN